MGNKIEIKQAIDSAVTVTKPAVWQTTAEAVTTETLQPTVSRPSRPSMSSSPSRGSMSSMFRLSKSFSRISQVVAPDLMGDVSDDDDDDDTDDTDDDDLDLDELRDGDEPLSQQEQDQIAAGQHTSISKGTNPFGPAGSLTSERSQFVPEKIQSEDQQMTSKGVNKNEQSKPQARSRSTTLEVPKVASPVNATAGLARPRSTSSSNPVAANLDDSTPASKTKTASAATTTANPSVAGSTSTVKPAVATAVETVPAPTTKPVVTKPRSESSPAKPSSPAPSDRFSTASTVRSSTISTEHSTTPPPAKVDPLAPTAAAPYGYKIISVKKPDGTIAKVKRPLKEGEKAPVVATKPKTAVTKTVSQTSTQKKTTTGSIDASISPIVSEKAPLGSVSEATETVTTATVKEVEGVGASGTSVLMAAETVSTATVTGVEVAPSSSAAKEPIVKATKVPEISEKPTDVQVTEKELEMVTSPRTPSTATAQEDQFKNARRLAQCFKIFVWSFGILLPLFFLGLAIATARLDGKRLPPPYDVLAFPSAATSTNSFANVGKKDKTLIDPLSQAIKVAASAWPIIFAAVIAQSLKMYAALKVERGIKLMQLEQLISSHSVGSALKQPFMLRTFNWTTVALFIIWCLSPLAGQAILRMSTTYASYDPIKTQLSYFSAQTMSQNSRDSGTWSYKGGYRTDVPSSWFESALVTALLQGYSQTQQLPQDIYRNLRIPVYQDKGPLNPTNFSSLIGYPFWIEAKVINGLNNTHQESEFAMTSSYFSFDCSDFNVVDAYGDVMKSHGLSLNINRTLAISAENGTNSTYVQESWYPPAPVNESNLLPGQPSVVGQPNVMNVTSVMKPTSTANGTTVATPTSVVNGTSTMAITSVVSPTGLLHGTSTVNVNSVVSPTGVLNGTSAVDSISTTVSTSTVDSVGVASPTNVLNETRIAERDVQQTTSSGVQMNYREPGPDGTLYYATRKNSQSVYLSTCSYRTVVVSTTFDCVGIAENATCFAIYQELVTPNQENVMPLGYWFPMVLQNLGSIDPYAGEYSQMEQFIVNPNFGAKLNLSNDDPIKFDAGPVTGSQLSERLGLVANTVWALGLNEGAFMGPDQKTWNSFEIQRETINATGEWYMVYYVYWPWVAVLIACSVILLVAAIAAAIWETRVVGPDFLGFANTAMKKNVKMPKHLNTMDARDRLIYLQDCEVILQDVRPEREVGRIALGVKDEESARLVAGRRYR